ncbi:hypothetical protein ACHAW6_002389 [Cyclotella cf. meneghiniana]
MTSLKRPKYTKIKVTDITDEIIEEYKLKEKVTSDRWVYIKVTKGMYGLPQAGSLGHELHKKRLNNKGYSQSQMVPSLWKHRSRPIQFVLVVDDFGIKYIKKRYLDHLIPSFENYYNLDWDYENKKVHLLMKPYLEKAVWQFNNTLTTKCQDSPYPHTPPKYRAKAQLALYDVSEPVGKKEQMHIPKVTRKFLWYVRAVDG